MIEFSDHNSTVAQTIFGDAGRGRLLDSLGSGLDVLTALKSDKAYRCALLVSEAVAAGLPGAALSGLFYEMVAYVVAADPEQTEAVFALQLYRRACHEGKIDPKKLGELHCLEQVSESPQSVAVTLLIDLLTIERVRENKQDVSFYCTAVLLQLVARVAGDDRDAVLESFIGGVRGRLFGLRAAVVKKVVHA